MKAVSTGLAISEQIFFPPPHAKKPGPSITNWNFQDCEPKQTFSLDKLIVSGIRYGGRNLTHISSITTFPA